MEITTMVQATKDIDIELENNIDSISILTKEHPSLIQEDDEIYFGDNPDIYGIFVGKDNPLMEKILELIYDN
jgi:hypothetical protein